MASFKLFQKISSFLHFSDNLHAWKWDISISQFKKRYQVKSRFWITSLCSLIHKQHWHFQPVIIIGHHQTLKHVIHKNFLSVSVKSKQTLNKDCSLKSTWNALSQRLDEVFKKKKKDNHISYHSLAFLYRKLTSNLESFSNTTTASNYCPVDLKIHFGIFIYVL